MTPSLERGGRRWLCRCLAAGVALFVSLSTPQAEAQAVRSIPSPIYYTLKDGLYMGDFVGAYQGFINETRGGAIKSMGGAWIDSIAVYCMAGESAFQTGNHKAALDAFDAALQVYLQHADWMRHARMDSPPLSPAAPGTIRNVPWGASKRRRVVGRFADQYSMAMGTLDVGDTIRKGGGVVTSPSIIPVDVAEIAFCTTWALKRRRDLLGPMSPHNPLNQEVLATLTRRPGQPNHWSECWISVELGMAYAAMGKIAQAETELQRGLLAAGQYDHPLTCIALLELGRMQMAAGKAPEALDLFAEASYSAAQFMEPLVLEEAFRLAFNTHMMSGGRGMFPPLSNAVAWANSNNTGGTLNWLLASLEIMAAENAHVIDQGKIAQDMIGRARSRVATTSMGVGKVGAQYQMVAAMLAYAQGQMAAGDQAVAKLIDFQRNGSLWLYQIARTDAERALGTGPLTARIAMDVYSQLLRDPTPVDWTTEPRESLSVMTVPHSISYETWFEVAVERKEFEKAFEIADRARRHRFLSSQALGGRTLNLQWILESPADALDRASAIQRQELLVRFPQYAKAAEQVAKLRAEMLQNPLIASNPAEVQAQTKKANEIAAQSLTQDALLRWIALRREPSHIVFPPLRETKDIQTSLPPGHAILSYFGTPTKVHVFLFTNENYGHAILQSPTNVRKSLETLLQNWAMYDGNKPMRLDELHDTRWKKPATELYQLLLADLRTDSKPLEELIVVPDSFVWYVPFEALQVPRGDTTHPLIQSTRVRYVPTASLAVKDTRPRRKSSPFGVVLGRLYPREPDELAQIGFDDLQRSVPEAVAIRGSNVPPSHIYSTLFDRLAIFADITVPDTGPLDWSPLPNANKGPGATLATWLDLPWGGPDQVFLPAFHTMAESAFRKGSTAQTVAANGQEMFQAICGLMATGTRTILISRWRPGGRSSYDFVREFAQEIPYSSAAAAWQRSVRLVSSSPLDTQLESRVAPDAAAGNLKADHPFFWAAYLLVDTGSEPQREGEPGEGVIKVKPNESAEPPAANPPPLAAPQRNVTEPQANERGAVVKP